MMVGELLTIYFFFENELGTIAVAPVFLKSFVVFFCPSSKCSTETKREARRVVIQSSPNMSTSESHHSTVSKFDFLKK